MQWASKACLLPQRCPDGQFDALIFVQLSYKLQIKRTADDTFSATHVKVMITSDHLHSWVVKGKQTDALLRHEQALYTIAAIAGRTLESKLSTLKAPTLDDLKQAAKDVFEEIAGNRSVDGRVISGGLVGDVQSRYDEDVVCGTDHSRNAANQAIWEQRINSTFRTKSVDISLLDSSPRLSAQLLLNPVNRTDTPNIFDRKSRTKRPSSRKRGRRHWELGSDRSC